MSCPRLKTNMTMCALCAGFTADVCPASHAYIELHLRGVPCPMNRHADKDGMVDELGVKWRGVPGPYRPLVWILWFRYLPLFEFLKSFSGCGCVDKLKEAAESALRHIRNKS